MLEVLLQSLESDSQTPLVPLQPPGLVAVQPSEQFMHLPKLLLPNL